MRRLTSFTKKTITAHDGLSLYYEVAGKGNTVLFFLHGMGGDVAAWDEIRTFFHQLGYTTIALDLRGHGYSDHPKEREGYSFDHFADDVADVIRHEKLKHCILIGHCFGAMVAYTYAARFPGTLAGLILISASFRAPYLSQQSPVKKVLHTLVRTVVPYSSRRYIPRHADYARGGFEHDFEPLGLFRVIKHNSLRTYLSLTDEVFSLDVLDALKKITTPTLVITGTNDTIYPSWMSEEIHRRIKDAVFVPIAKGNHPIVLNNPMEVSVTISDFLRKSSI